MSMCLRVSMYVGVQVWVGVYMCVCACVCVCVYLGWRGEAEPSHPEMRPLRPRGLCRLLAALAAFGEANVATLAEVEMHG